MNKPLKQPFQFSFTLREADLFWGNLRATYSRLPFKIITGLCCFLVFMTVLSLLIGAHVGALNLLGTLILPLFTFVFLPYAISRNIKKIYKNVKLFSEKQTFVFDSKGIHVKGHSFTRDFALSDFTKLKKYKSIILIWFGKCQVFVIPRRDIDEDILQKLEAIAPNCKSTPSKNSKPAYSLIFAFVIMTVIMLIATTTVKNTTGKLAYYREMEGPIMAKLAAESAAENGIVSMKDRNAGFESSATESFCEDADSDGTCETWGDYEVLGKAGELGGAGTGPWYTPMPGTGTAGDPDHCSLLNIDEDEDHPCNWNKLLFGDTVTIPLYSDDGSGGIFLPNDLGFNNWKLRVRTPCDDGDLNDAGCTRIMMDTRDSTGRFDIGGDSVILWQLVGENAEGTVSLVPDDEDTRSGFNTIRHPTLNTEIYETKINNASNYVVLEAADMDPYQEIYQICTEASPYDAPLTLLSLQLNIVTPLKDSDDHPIPYLEWQLVTEASEPFGDTKAVIEGKGYHQGQDGIFYFPYTITRSTTGESTNVYTVSN